MDMQKETAIVLRNRLKSLPFVDLLAGLVQTLTTQTSAEGLAFVTEKRPVSYDVVEVKEGVSTPYGGCAGKEVPMLPNSSRKSIIFFEDRGINATDRRFHSQGYTSDLRLVCWMNKLNLVADAYANIAGPCMTAIIAAVAREQSGNPKVGALTLSRFKTVVQDIPRQNASIFSEYTIKETDRQYLRPPYEFFAIDFRSTFYVDPRCVTAIDFNQKACN